MKVLKPDHPLADGGLVFEHRLVVYEDTQGADPSCFWCDKAMTWATVVLDHLNEVKDDLSEREPRACLQRLQQDTRCNGPISPANEVRGCRTLH